MAIIKTKIPNFTGYRASVFFKHGVGSTNDEHLIDWFRTHGYTIETENEVKPKVDVVSVEPTIKRRTKTKD